MFLRGMRRATSRNFVITTTCFLLISCSEPAETAVPKLIEKLHSADKRERNQAALALAGYGKAAEPAVTALITVLRDPNPGIRTSAAYALREIDTPDAQAALDRAENVEKRR